MRERIADQPKKATTASFSIPALAKPTRGFGLDSSDALPQAVPFVQPVNKPLGHDISRISLRPQTKLTANHSGEIYKHEADNVAQQVMQRTSEPANQQSIQREEVPEEEEELLEEEEVQTKSLGETPLLQHKKLPEKEEKLQMKPLGASSPIGIDVQPLNKPLVDNISQISQQPPQTKLTINQPGDVYEQEADNVAKQVMQRINSPVSRQSIQRETLPESENQLQMKSLANSITPLVQRQGGGRITATSDLESSIHQARGNGRPLSNDIRQPMEQAFGTDFSSVKIHTDSQSDQLNQSIQARAFTTGQDIFFRQGEYAPESQGGKELLAHELTHVVQQNGSAVQPKSLPDQEVKNNKIQAKVLPTSPLNKQLIQRRENPQQQPEPDKQAQLEQTALKADVQNREQQRQAATNQDTAASPPADSGSTGGAANPPPAGTGGATNPPPGGTGGAANPPPANTGGTANPPPANTGGANVGGGQTGQDSNPVNQPTNSISAEDPGQILEQLKNTPPTQAFTAYTQAETASTQALENQRQQLQTTIPEIPAPTGLSPQSANPAPNNSAPVNAKSGEPASGQQPAQPVGAGTSAIAASESPQSQEPPKPVADNVKSNPNPVGGGNTAIAASSDGDISSISINVGERPKVDMTGEADPSQMDGEQAQSLQQVQAAKVQAASSINQDFGESNIFPKASNQTLKANKELSKVSSFSGKGGEMPTISPEVVGGLNQGLTPYYQAKIAPEQQKYLTGKQQFDADSGNARKDSDQQITNLNQEAKQKQLEQQKQTQQEVAQARQDWQSELDNQQKDYQDKAGKASKEQQQKIDNEKAKGEQQADQKLTEAEQEAADKKKKAEEDAAKEKEKSQRKSGWQKFVGFFKDVWDGIKKAVNAIFDFVRKAVKAIFDAVKKVVKAIIDVVRTVIVGLIKAFGEILKVLVKVVFAAFPEISKKFTDAIDKAVNKATEIVNSVADFLQKAVSAVLDFLAKIIDKLLGLVQGIYNAVFTVIGMLITGEFAELIKRFGYLIDGAKAMPSQFETAALEELMGGGELDLDKPLSPAELAQAQQAGVSIPGMEGENTPETDEAGEVPSAPWSEENVGVDAVEDNMELSPEIAEELMQQTQGEGEVMLAESQEDSRSMDAIMSEATGEQQVGAEQEQQISDGLTPKQRAGIKWELMKQGIKDWFSKNWPILLAAFIAAAAVIIAAIVASGGAVLAALPVLMDILTVVFAAEVIAKIGGYLSDYISKSWQGDIQGGGKSLAKALAAAAIELVMLLTFEAGKVASKGVKAAAKGTAKIAGKASRAVIKGAKYVISKGKVLFKGIAGSGVGKQFRRLGELGEALLSRMRFKGFRIRVANGWFRLEGLINPWVLIAEGKITTEIKDPQGKVKPVDKETPKATFITDDELEAVTKGGTPKTSGPIKDYEVLEYRQTKTSGTDARGKVGDKLTGDHIPSNGALLKAKEAEIYSLLENKTALKSALAKLDNSQKDEIMQLLTKRRTSSKDVTEISNTIKTATGSPLTSAQKRAVEDAIKDINSIKGKIENEAVTVVLKDTTHETLSRTYGGRNTATQIAGDAKDLGKAFRNDAEAIFEGLHKDKKLTTEIVGAYMNAYRENVRKGVFAYSDEADKMFIKYLKEVKTGIPPSRGIKRPLSSSTASSSKKPRTS